MENDHMRNYVNSRMEEIVGRASLSQLCRYLTSGLDPTKNDTPTPEELLTKAQKEMQDNLRKLTGNEQEYEDVYYQLMDITEIYEEVFMELGIKIGVKLIIQLLFQD